MDYYIKTNNGKELLDDKTGHMISVFIIKKIVEDYGNFCVLDKIYSNINKYSNKNNFYFYKIRIVQHLNFLLLSIVCHYQQCTQTF